MPKYNRISNISKADILFWIDGPMLPMGDGGSSIKHGIIKSFNSNSRLRMLPVFCHWGLDNPSMYKEIGFDCLFLKPPDFYFNSMFYKQILNIFQPKVFLFDCVDTAIKISPHLKNHGIRSAVILHNIDYILFSRLGAKEEVINDALEKTTSLLNLVDVAFVRSEIDISYLNKIQNKKAKISLAKGGVDTKEIKFSFNNEKEVKALLLANMFYSPNYNGAMKLLKVWGDEKLNIIGPIPQNFIKSNYKKNIRFFGQIPELSDIMNDCTIGLVPVDQGSGTRVKILFYMSAGLPVITTELGVEGLDDLRPFCYIENDIAKFPERMNLIIQDPQLEQRVKNGRRKIEDRYEWSACIFEYQIPLEELAGNNN